MTRVEVVDGRLKVEVLGWHRLWAFKSRLDFPLKAFVSAQRWDRDKLRFSYGANMQGTYVPGLIVAGTFYTLNRTYFYDVCEFSSAIEIELRNEFYRYVVVEVEEPEATLKLINEHTTPSPESEDSLPVTCGDPGTE